jgi:hypothetical protein
MENYYIVAPWHEIRGRKPNATKRLQVVTTGQAAECLRANPRLDEIIRVDGINQAADLVAAFQGLSRMWKRHYTAEDRLVTRELLKRSLAVIGSYTKRDPFLEVGLGLLFQLSMVPMVYFGQDEQTNQALLLLKEYTTGLTRLAYGYMDPREIHPSTSQLVEYGRTASSHLQAIFASRGQGLYAGWPEFLEGVEHVAELIGAPSASYPTQLSRLFICDREIREYNLPLLSGPK